LLLLLFNVSRSAYWSLRSVADQSSAARSRAGHFRQVVRHFTRAWPATGGQPA